MLKTSMIAAPFKSSKIKYSSVQQPSFWLRFSDEVRFPLIKINRLNTGNNGIKYLPWMPSIHSYPTSVHCTYKLVHINPNPLSRTNAAIIFLFASFHMPDTRVAASSTVYAQKNPIQTKPFTGITNQPREDPIAEEIHKLPFIHTVRTIVLI